jgi:hypothetical protein
MFHRLAHIAILLLISGQLFSQSSVLNSGRWYKIAVTETGVYRINADQLKKMGFDLAKTDPRRISVFGQHGGMLPQLNSATRPSDLVQLAIQVVGEEDGVFNSQDYILFYGTGPDRVDFRPEKRMFFYENNLYSDVNYYFITVSETHGKRIGESVAGSGGSVITTFHDVFYFEKDEHNELRSGREWFGERFDLTKQHSVEIDIPGISLAEPIRLVSDVMASSVNPSSFRILFNDQQVGEQLVPVIPNTTYGAKGRQRRDTLVFDPGSVSASQRSRQKITFAYTPGSSGRSVGYLNYFSIHVLRNLQLYGNQTRFRNASGNGSSAYHLSGTGTDVSIWNISNPYDPVRQNFVPEAGSLKFSASPEASGAVPEFIVFNTKYLAPQLIGPVENQNLRGQSTPAYLIVTHPDFLAEAQRLATHRGSINNWSSLVVTTDQIYQEFSSGRQDVGAIRDYVKHLYDKNPSALKVLLLFGKCSYDFKDRIPGNTNFVPTYESRNSLSPLETYSSDDFFGFLEDDEGEWGENLFLQNHTLDIGVGRLPVKTPAEAKNIVDKLIAYDLNQDRFGHWRKDFVFVADDGSNSDGFTSIHQSQANVLADDIESNYPWYNTRKIFLGTYPKIVSPNGESIPQAKADLIEEFGKAVVINYTGHGSEKLWADERILTEEAVENLSNKHHPFLVTATCEFGRHDDPREISGAERSVLSKNGGSIGLVTTARPVNSSTNFSLNAAFYDALFILNNDHSMTLGEVFRHTKNNSASGVANRNFSLLGDPAMKLALPRQQIKVDEIKTINGSDTLKALSTVVVKGRVNDADENLITTFNGIVHATVFDKRTSFETIGRNDPAFTFKQFTNALFRGEASVVDGLFEVRFIMPRNIAYGIDYGKLSLYAFNDDRTLDVAGTGTTFKIGGSEANVPVDNTSPELSVYLGDTTFVDGGLVSPNTLLVVNVRDDSGINISNYGIGNTMMAVLDNDGAVFLLNEYYTASKDDFSQGWIRYPLQGLSPGEHTLTVKVWDTHNNPAEKTIRFAVSSPNEFVIENFGNYPNPFSDETTFFFRHNRPGQPIDGRITVLSTTGQQIGTIEFEMAASAFESTLDFKMTESGKKLPPGIYLGHLQIRSLSDGRRTERVTKLIVSN